MSAHVSTNNVTAFLQSYSVLAVALAAGTNISTSIITLPALLHAPAPTLATQWKILFDTGITPVVSLAMSSGVGFATLAYRSSFTHGTLVKGVGVASHMQRNLYIAAAIAAFGLAPYTRLLMWNNIAELERRASLASEKQDKEGTHELVKTWGAFNLWRGVLLLSSATLGIWASVS